MAARYPGERSLKLTYPVLYVLEYKRNGLTVKAYASRKQRTYIRWQRSHPNSLWQTDIKYCGNPYLIAFLDDCSRDILEAALLHNAITDGILSLLEKALTMEEHHTKFHISISK